jgi:hypothetical protein
MGPKEETGLFPGVRREGFLYARHESVWSNERIAPLILYLGRDGIGRLAPSKQHAVRTEWESKWLPEPFGTPREEENLLAGTRHFLFLVTVSKTAMG